jgi:hypothetical protein
MRGWWFRGVAEAMKRFFGPTEFRGGQVQVYGCSPGCILVSILVSIVLTIVLNLFLRWIF